ncbi:MAG TPA: FliO/MopB family protein [Peptococcaceae bacterium]|nr:FliO/MopB family protein [Peptococcaceae bacterium]
MPNSFNENQPYDPSLTPSPAAEPFSWASLIATVVIFLLILTVALWLLKKLNRYTVRSIQSPWVRVLDRQVLNGQQTLYLVEIAGKIQILGATDHHLTKVAEINDPAIVAEILEEIASRPEEKMDRFLMGIWKRLKRRKSKDSFSLELERLIEEDKK